MTIGLHFFLSIKQSFWVTGLIIYKIMEIDLFKTVLLYELRFYHNLVNVFYEL